MDIEFASGRPAKDGNAGLVLTDLTLHFLRLVRADVGRIGDDDVEELPSIEIAGQQIALGEMDAVAEAETLGVLYGDGESIRRDVHGMDLSLGQLRGKS